MSRAEPGGHSAAAIPGEVALPLPSGDPQALRLAARSLERAAARAGSTTTVRGTLATRLDAVWSGAAAAAARDEADELGRRSRRVVDGLSPTARSLRTYAAVLELAVTRVRSLQRQWDGLDAERALACLRLAALPDPTGVLAAHGIERARAEQALGRARLSRSYEQVLDELRGSGRRCAQLLAGVTDVVFPSAASPTGVTVRSAVTGGLWFADGAFAARASRDAALSDGVLVRRVIAASAAPNPSLDDAAVGQLAARVRARVDDPVYAQALLSELGADGLAPVLMAAGVARGGSGAHVDTVRDLLGGFGSLLLTATSHSTQAGTDPRTREQLASGAALLADDLVAGLGRVHRGPDEGRATGAWLVGQLLSGARAAGDGRRLPSRLARRAAAAAAAAEVAETRDADTRLRHGTTLAAGGADIFASWFDDASGTGDALHVLIDEVGDDPAEQAALLAEPLPDSAVAGGALANSRGDRLTLGEHLVRRWVTLEASGIESHPDLRLATDADLLRLLHSVSSDASGGAAETRGRVMLEVSRTSGHAMREASTTQIYTRATAPLEGHVADWLTAMRENVDRALAQRDPVPDDARTYAATTTRGMQPWLDVPELTAVVGTLAADTGMGLHAKDPGAAYTRLVETALRATRESVEAGHDTEPDVVRIGFFDQAASAELVALARRQDGLNRSALQSLAEAGHVVAEIRSGNLTGLASTVKTYVDGGTTRTAADDLVIAMVRSDVELAQTERNDSSRAELAARLTALTGGSTDVRSSLAAGGRRGPALPTAEELRTARREEVEAAVMALRDERMQSLAESRMDRLKDRGGAPHPSHVNTVHSPVPDPSPGMASTPGQAAERLRRSTPTGAALKGDALHRSGSWVLEDVPEKGTVFPLVGGDGVERTLIQMPGSVNDVEGRFEWILEGDRITHQLFVRDGKITGVPIKP